MAHPYSQHRQTKVEHERVRHIAKGYARGGAVEPEMEEDDEPGSKSGDTRDESGRKHMRRGGKPKMKLEGKAAKHHMGKRKRGGPIKKRAEGGSADDFDPEIEKDFAKDIADNSMRGRAKGGKVYKGGEKTAPMEDDDMPQRADGGRVGRKKASQTIVNVMMGPDKQPTPPQQVPVPVKVPVPVPQAGPPPGAIPPGMPQGAPPPGVMPPPGMIGRAKGGKVTKGTATYEDSLKNGTQVSHSPGKNDIADLGIKTPVIPTKKFARGGALYSEDKPMGPKMEAGAVTGDGRLEKTALQKRVG
jgi:hypothetical protein